MTSSPTGAFTESPHTTTPVSSAPASNATVTISPIQALSETTTPSVPPETDAPTKSPTQSMLPATDVTGISSAVSMFNGHYHKKFRVVSSFTTWGPLLLALFIGQ
jgi:hypothetical protein